jgi:hypothetical protein
MGLYVVARLAKRHNITVRLRDNEDIEGGLIARINVPAELVQPIGAPQRSMGAPTGPASLGSLSDATSTDSQLNAPLGNTNAPSRNSGIAGAFTGGMPRLRQDGSPAGADISQDRSPSEVASYPPFQPNGFDGGPGTPANGVPAQPAPPALEQNGRHDQPTQTISTGDTGTALFGAPMPEPQQQPTSYESSYGTGTTPPAAHPDVDAPTERLPIYEAVLSQWFEAADTGSAPQVRVPDETPVDVGVNGNGHNGNGNGHAPVEEAEVPEPTPWTSPGDDGWLAARALLEDKAPDTTTSAGLPKRVPKAHLVPGSAAPRHEAKEPSGDMPASPPLPPRTADAVRGRMSSFQQGVRRGRHALIDAYAGDQSSSEHSRKDEEQE